MNKLYFGYHPAFTLTRNRLVLLLLSLFITHLSFAQENMHMVPVSLEQRVQAADMVLEGEVVSKMSFWDARHENIYTSNIIKVYKVFKGAVQEQQLEVITEGGTVGLDKHVYSVALNLKQGEQGIFFLEEQDIVDNTPGKMRYSMRPYASEQGFIHYNTRSRTADGVFESYASVEQVYRAISEKTGTNYRTISNNEVLQARPQQQAQQSVLAPIITSFSPRTASAGTRTVLTINGTGFGNERGDGTVSFRNADDGGRTFTEAPDDAYISWTNTQIRMYIPSASADGGTAGTGEIRITANDGTVSTSLDKLTIIYAYSNLFEEEKTYQPALIDVDGEGGYSIRFAPSMQSRSSAQEGFIRAMNSWICNTNVNWKIGAPTTKETSAADDEVVIRFAPGSDVGAGVLARTLSRYRGCEIIATGEINWWLSEFDMEINNNITWQYGPGPPDENQFDFETVMLHELGHAHQLGHVILPAIAVMHFELEVKRYYRDLSQADIEGGRFVMATSLKPNKCQRPLMEPKLDGECNLAEEVTTLQAAYTSEADVEITWTTSSEANIARYVIERSADGSVFESIGTVDASDVNTFIDQAPLPRTGFYRLRVEYTDGSFKYTSKVRVTDPQYLYKFEIWPNPVGAEQHFNILFLVERSTPMQLYLYDMTGRVVRSMEVTFTDVNMPLEFDMTGIAAGTYILKWTSTRNSGTTKIVKL